MKMELPLPFLRLIDVDDLIGGLNLKIWPKK